MNLRGRSVTLHDMSLRDGMHPKRHQISRDQMVAVATALDDAGMPLIEVTHGDGLGGASINYGFPSHSDEEYLRAVIPRMKRARVSALLLPGIGTIEHLRMAVGCGVRTIRVATAPHAVHVAFCMAMLAGIFFENLSEFEFFRSGRLMWALFVAILTYLGRELIIARAARAVGRRPVAFEPQHLTYAATHEAVSP